MPWREDVGWTGGLPRFIHPTAEYSPRPQFSDLRFPGSLPPPSSPQTVRAPPWPHFKPGPPRSVCPCIPCGSRRLLIAITGFSLGSGALDLSAAQLPVPFLHRCFLLVSTGPFSQSGLLLWHHRTKAGPQKGPAASCSPEALQSGPPLGPPPAPGILKELGSCCVLPSPHGADAVPVTASGPRYSELSVHWDKQGSDHPAPGLASLPRSPEDDVHTLPGFCTCCSLAPWLPPHDQISLKCHLNEAFPAPYFKLQVLSF